MAVIAAVEVLSVALESAVAAVVVVKEMKESMGVSCGTEEVSKSFKQHYR